MRPSFAFIILLIPFLISGCVSKSVYQKKTDEAKLLAKTVDGLETERQQLMQQKEELAGLNKNLDKRLAGAMEKNSALQQDFLRARADIDRLEKVFSARSEEAGKAMAEMRQTIDRLEVQNRELDQQVEKERIARQARIAQMKSTYDELVDKMESEIRRGEITISELQGKLTVNMVERILFDSGEAEIKAAGLEVLRRVGNILKGVEDKHVRVEGHTDDVPISSRLQQIFPTNWELSAARATNVVRFLQSEVGIEGKRLSACGFSKYRPVADNDTPEGRAQNRRIQIVLMPLEAKIVTLLE
jgi:chemotaxis protein MotB